ncbi:hypothetical protein SAMN05880501_1173 [Ureibacillus xyleni]|uniref:Uncharacterized protein n=1 Tax=Ureibacillus xyleni TaxID=614648 RepID=A0A285TNE6_9BACL|nr:hypothetical protein [Ureibacillus xyleni]SOC24283.1 hypothetical protein SAMN05880501_1173 [Ureibacillus xyleni]
MKKLNFLLILFLSFIGTIFTPQIIEAATLFNQGTGYEHGAYDLNAIQPTSENWTRHSSNNMLFILSGTKIIALGDKN